MNIIKGQWVSVKNECKERANMKLKYIKVGGDNEDCISGTV